MSEEKQAAALEQVRREITTLLEQIKPPLPRQDIEAQTAAILTRLTERNGNGGPPP